METPAKTEKMIRQRKFMLALPILVLPFITFLFWSLGGGKPTNDAVSLIKFSGFNTSLPNANLEDDAQMNKMKYYEQAQKDSAKYLELTRNDMTYMSMALPDELDDTPPPVKHRSGSPAPSGSKGLNTSLYDNGSSNDPTTDKIYSKLAELDKELNKPVEPEPDVKDAIAIGPDASPRYDTGINADVQKLEAMMQAMSQSGGEDPEMQQINSMLETIMDIQHPDRVEQKMKALSEVNRGQVYTVSATGNDDSISLLQTKNQVITASASEGNGFYSLSDETVTTGEISNAIQAVIHETQTLVNGSVVKLRLVNDVYINGLLIPKDNFIFGIASLSGERLTIKINSIRYNNSLFPVELAVYDMDGLDGIYIPGAITRDVSKQSADRSLQSIGLTSLDQSWGAQAASAGIEAVKVLFSKKVKLVRVTVKAGYQVLLFDEKQKQNQ